MQRAVFRLISRNAAIYDPEEDPFKVIDDEKMHELVESIMTNGVLVPVIVRPTEDDECTKRWTELFLMVVIGVGIIAVLFASVVIQESCDSLREKIREL